MFGYIVGHKLFAYCYRNYMYVIIIKLYVRNN